MITPFENKVWLASPTMHGEELTYVTEAYETNWMSTVGKNINEAEKAIAEKVGVTYGVALASGTASLHLAMKLAGYAIGTEDVSENPTEAWEQCKLIGNIQ